ncbi:ParA family protein [Paenibacillus eucommiae]|uniref:Chromosome partitioning protein n=1 Tax=Paenibacillus eucommiae TaxID=1355755 RepID=A0ABS4J940_9BACL|nr:ParA family protein [Paenibacillus eucommiae]MBP1996372.1 chromosome partitioning protein [Paenibacillus eucommiae]
MAKSMAKIFSVCMNKGGVGKTSLVTHLAAVVASMFPKKKILILDTDAQGNAAVVFGTDPEKAEYTMYDVFLGDKQIDEIIIPITANLDLAPASDKLNMLEFHILSQIDAYKNPFLLLKQQVDKIKSQYDYIFIDCPPSLGLVAGNVLKASTGVLIPFVPEAFSVKGLQRVIQAIDAFGTEDEPAPSIIGIVAMMVDRRSRLHQELLSSASEFCQKKNIRLFDTVIPRSISFANSAAYEGTPIVWSGRSSIAADAYISLTKEVLDYAKKKKRTAR